MLGASPELERLQQQTVHRTQGAWASLLSDFDSVCARPLPLSWPCRVGRPYGAGLPQVYVSGSDEETGDKVKGALYNFISMKMKV